jgi:hypothetical protein
VNYAAAFRRRSRRCLPCRSRRHTREQTSASGRPANDRPHSVQSRSTREHPATRSTTFEDPPQSGFLSPAASCSADRGKERLGKNAREPGEGSSSLVPSSDLCPSLPQRDASPVSIGKDRYQNDDEDDPKQVSTVILSLESASTLRGMDDRRWGRSLGTRAPYPSASPPLAGPA